MNRKQLIAAILLVAGVATAGGLVYAKQGDHAQNDAVADLAKAKVCLSQAVGSAEARVGGKATKAELEGERGVVVFNVEVVTADSQVFDVKVDATDGKVLSSRADAADHGGEEDERD